MQLGLKDQFVKNIAEKIPRRRAAAQQQLDQDHADDRLGWHGSDIPRGLDDP